MAPMDDEMPDYCEVVAADGRYRVVNESGRTLVVCRDEHSASEYAVLLNEAWRRGFKAGYRSGRGLEPRR